ncbi:MAG: phosphatidylglycerophosphatase [Hyphomicrobiaceae bacterium]
MPEFDPNFDPLSLVLLALLNPVVVVAALYLGTKADQWQKLIVVGFASALAGAVAIWIVTFLGLLPPRPYGSDAGLFGFSCIYGAAIGWLGYLFRKKVT